MREPKLGSTHTVGEVMGVVLIWFGNSERRKCRREPFLGVKAQQLLASHPRPRQTSEDGRIGAFQSNAASRSDPVEVTDQILLAISLQVSSFV